MLLAFAAQHVVDEVEEHLEDWCEQAGVSHRSAWSVWSQEFKPLITVVDFDPDLLSPEETRRIATLAQRDNDDVPTAVAALILGAPLLGLDRDSLEAVYELPIEYERHRAYVERLRSNSEAELLAYLGTRTLQAALLASVALAGGVRALHARIGTLALVGLGAGLVLTASLSDRVRSGWSDLKHLLSAAGGAAGDFLLLHRDCSLDYQGIAIPAFGYSDLPEQTLMERDTQVQAAVSRAQEAAATRLDVMRAEMQSASMTARAEQV